MTPEAFIAKWGASSVKESAGSQEHFIDLCRLLGEPTPIEADPSGKNYAFEAGATKTTGKQGWADVWKRGCFAWEYKGKGRDLQAAYAQLQQYAVALENPPLLVVSDMERIVVHTNWTNTIKETYEFSLEDLGNARRRDLLKAVFSEPDKLKPGRTRQSLTEDAAKEFAELAGRLRAQGHEPQRVAHFVNRLVFCMFAEDEGLLPREMFSRMLTHSRDNPAEFVALASDLFAAMGSGGRVGFEKVAWFNGGLFDSAEALPLDRVAIDQCLRAAQLDWSEIDVSIFGTLFERGLDPDKRSQLGAHYTDRDKIMMIVEPVVIRPLMREWEVARAAIREKLARRDETKGRAQRTKIFNEADRQRKEFLERLRKFRVLDPACGSGNFLYLALHALKDIEHRVNIECEAMGFRREFPAVGPEAVHGIEINAYAAELARATIWIGELQWMRRNGFAVTGEPILRPLETVECRDAVLNADGTEAKWPKVDVIIGNPPFLGDRFHRRILGEEYVFRLRTTYKGRVAPRADLVVYWFEKARGMLEDGVSVRFGLVGTKSVAKGASREPLVRITKSDKCRLFEAWTNEPWVVDGAAVRVAIVCASNDSIDWQTSVRLNGINVSAIGADLAAPIGEAGVSMVNAKPLRENKGVAFQGVKLTGSFDLTGQLARDFLVRPVNPNGRSNSDVVKRLWDIDDVVGRPSDRWVIDFGPECAKTDAQLYQAPFERLQQVIPPQRSKVREKRVREHFWLFQRPRGALRKAIAGLNRFVVTPESSEHRLFCWATVDIIIVGSLFAIARDDDTSFGILHSRLHEIWATAQGNRLGAGNQRRYNITVTFETFPFPAGLTPNTPAADYAADPRAAAIAEAARRLDELRQAWLNPPDLVERVPEVVPGFPDRIVPRGAKAAATLKKRTLTNLYNERPAWLEHAHRDLDAAVAAAYGWPADISEEDALARLFALNQARAIA